ncbi:hypothetical protein QTI66_31105 [Variovorax sp. J22R133]|uniref:uracil-DNA glycosylase family protein n=1 Tax=Variovorax brevis TaxID=3053503 RepID=UPI0025785F5B|nr:uracil-DNA glycosylase family protein [Variovorax sp. J22R133]MDM0116596.1 hypothetical protein [Variovorax sp. J22R133]
MVTICYPFFDPGSGSSLTFQLPVAGHRVLAVLMAKLHPNLDSRNGVPPAHGHAPQSRVGEFLPCLLRCRAETMSFAQDHDGVTTGRPGGFRRRFVGPAGKLFDRVLVELGWSRKDLYMTNAVKRFKYECAASVQASGHWQHDAGRNVVRALAASVALLRRQVGDARPESQAATSHVKRVASEGEANIAFPLIGPVG